MKDLYCRFIFLLLLLTVVADAFSQKKEKKTGSDYKDWFFSFQPMVLFEMPRGGVKIGIEKIIVPRVGLALDAAWRMINYDINNDLQAGEEEKRSGFQLQPEVKWYFKKSSRQKAEPKHSLSVRFGYARYDDGFTNWRTFIDGAGNSYQKLTGFHRVQQNFDISVMASTKLYFSKQQRNHGGEVFVGLGARQKNFSYTRLSPELNADELRELDENRLYSLLRNGGYPILNGGFRFFFRK